MLFLLPSSNLSLCFCSYCSAVFCKFFRNSHPHCILVGNAIYLVLIIGYVFSVKIMKMCGRTPQSQILIRKAEQLWKQASLCSRCAKLSRQDEPRLVIKGKLAFKIRTLFQLLLYVPDDLLWSPTAWPVFKTRCRFCDSRSSQSGANPFKAATVTQQNRQIVRLHSRLRTQRETFRLKWIQASCLKWMFSEKSTWNSHRSLQNQNNWTL